MDGGMEGQAAPVGAIRRGYRWVADWILLAGIYLTLPLLAIGPEVVALLLAFPGLLVTVMVLLVLAGLVRWAAGAVRRRQAPRPMGREA